MASAKTRPLEKACSSIKYVNDSIKTIRSRSWAKPVGMAMSVTASIVECFNWIPGVGIVGGALKLGSSLLNPAPSLQDLRKQIQDIESHVEGSSQYVKDLLGKQILDIERQLENPEKELLDDDSLVKQELQVSARIISKDMLKIESDLYEVKSIVRKTYSLVIDTRYKEGIEKIDAAFQNFIKGSHNLENTFASLANFMFELETNAIQCLNTEKINAYLKAIKETECDEVCDQVFQYIILVRAKYLQISCAYYIFNKDSQRVANEFESFNRDFYQLHQIYKSSIGLSSTLSNGAYSVTQNVSERTNIDPSRERSSLMPFTETQSTSKCESNEVNTKSSDRGMLVCNTGK